ncbi:unnamed protein product, partial [Rotaria magnacalcarata]
CLSEKFFLRELGTHICHDTLVPSIVPKSIQLPPMSGQHPQWPANPTPDIH